MMAIPGTPVQRVASLIGERDLVEHNEVYRRFWIGRLFSDVAFNAMIYTMLLLIAQSTGKSFFSSLFVAAYIGPAALFVALAGSVSDALPKNLVLAVTSVVQAGLCLLVAVSGSSLWVIYLIAVGFAVTAQFLGPTKQSALPQMVDREQISNANAVNNLGSLVAQTLGLLILPPLFLQTVGAAPLAIICGLLFLGAAFHFAGVSIAREEAKDAGDVWSGSLERMFTAWHEFTEDAVSYLSMSIVVLASVISIVVLTLAPAYSGSVLHVSSDYTALVLSPAAFGVWLALRLAPHISGRRGPAVTIGVAFATLIAAVILLGFVDSLARIGSPWVPPIIFTTRSFDRDAMRIFITIIIAMAIAFSYTFLSIETTTVLNRRVPQEIQGRVFAAQTVIASLASIPPVLFAGIAADFVGVSPVLVVTGCAIAILTVFAIARGNRVAHAAVRRRRIASTTG